MNLWKTTIQSQWKDPEVKFDLCVLGGARTRERKSGTREKV